MKLRCCCFALVAMFTLATQSGAAAREQTSAGITEERVRPSQANPAVTNFDDASVVLTPAGSSANTPLALFLSGTGGRPENAMLLLRTIAGQGYRVIGLTYDDVPAVAQVCPRDPDPACSAKFRQVRTFGRGEGPVQNPPAEAINARLVSLLQYLDRQHPGQGWNGYLTGEGRPAWSRMLVSGLSQGAGMAAFIAHLYPVYRVVLFSSPWDTTGRDQRPAPWLSRPPATPPDRWYAERHTQENTTELIAHAYAALRIPQNHIWLFDLPLNHPARSGAQNPFHGSTIMNPNYIPQWQQMYGRAEALPN